MKKLIPWLVAGAVGLAYLATSDAATTEHCWESRTESKLRHFFNRPCEFKGHVGGSVTIVDVREGASIKGCSIYSPSQRVFIMYFPGPDVTTFMSIDDFDYSMKCIWRKYY